MVRAIVPEGPMKFVHQELASRLVEKESLRMQDQLVEKVRLLLQDTIDPNAKCDRMMWRRRRFCLRCGHFAKSSRSFQMHVPANLC